MTLPTPDPAAPRPASEPVERRIGAYRLLQLLGRSARTMLWLANEPHSGRDCVLAMPRARPPDATVARHWHEAARRAARIDHPSLMPVLEIGEHERWPYVAYAGGAGELLSTRLGREGQSAAEAVPWVIQLLGALAFAHEAGAAHCDIQPHMVLFQDRGPVRLLGLGVALESHHTAIRNLQQHRDASERDLLALGIVMHHVLTGAPALDEPDVSKVIERLPPKGRDVLRVSWSTTRPIPEAVRAIVNRATDRQERHRYHHARTVLRALEGWLKAEGEHGAGPLAILLDRLNTIGLLPATPGAAQHAARMALMDRERNDELAEVVLQDTALTFELLRIVNSAQVRGPMVAGSGPILTVRRAIDMIGLDGVRRAALSLRAWPGPLNGEQAAALERLIARARRAGRIARWLRPAGYDGELVFLLALLQNLGRLVLRYHFADEAAQIERLMKPSAATDPERADEPGMSEEAASFAVLGIDLASIGAAIGRHWGLDDAVLQMIERVPAAAPVRAHGSDHELLRLTASCANEVVDAQQQPPNREAAALQRVVQRYGRVLGVTLRDLQSAAQGLPPPTGQHLDAATTQFGAVG